MLHLEIDKVFIAFTTNLGTDEKLQLFKGCHGAITRDYV